MNRNIIGNILKGNLLSILILIAVLLLSYFFVIGLPAPNPDAPIPAVISNYKKEKQLITDIQEKKEQLERILADKQRKLEAAKKATVKDFYKVQSPTNNTETDFAPMFDNIITMIKQNGIRMKSIKYEPNIESEDNLVKNGNMQYKGCKVNFVLVGYYPQLTALLNDINAYPYFINVSKFEIEPYQYDKRILIAKVSVTFYSKN